MEELPLDPDTADRILSGQVAPDDAPPGYASLSALIRAAHQAPEGGEVRGEEEAVELMLASMAAPREWTAPPSRRPGRHGRVTRARAAVVATVTILASTSGFAVAGALPRGAQAVVSDVFASVGLDIIPNPAKTAELAVTADTGDDDDRRPVARPTTTEARGAAPSSSSTSSSTSSSSTSTTLAPSPLAAEPAECPSITDGTAVGDTADDGSTTTTTTADDGSTTTSSSSTSSTTSSSTSTTTSTTTPQDDGTSSTTTTTPDGTTTTTLTTDPECADDAASEVTDGDGDDGDAVSSPTRASGRGEAVAAGRRRGDSGTSEATP